MFIQTELTPNPETLKFLPGRVVMKEGTAFFQKDHNDFSNSPLAQRLFKVEGVSGVFFGSDFITITKENNIKINTLEIFSPKKAYQIPPPQIISILSNGKLKFGNTLYTKE